MTGKDSELLTSIRCCLQGLTLFTAEISAGGVLVAVYFLNVTGFNPSGSDSAVGPEGEILAAATSLYDKVIPAGVEIVGKASAGRAVEGTRWTQAASLWDISTGRKRCSPVKY
jgi:hypothetical protein